MSILRTLVVFFAFSTAFALVGLAQQPSSAVHNAGNHSPGYFLIAPLKSTGTYLINREGQVVHKWRSRYMPGMAAYLLENGHLLRTGNVGPMGNRTFLWGGTGGVIEEFDWDGNLVWRFEYNSDEHLSHHDIEPLPNGHVLLVAWEAKSQEEALAAGRDPRLAGPQGMWSTVVVEVRPRPPAGGEIVWEWHVWDHLVQDKDPDLQNYGDIADRPERININPPDWVGGLTKEQREELQALGYLGPGGGGAPSPMQHAHPDWNHTNSVDYNPALDQIALSMLGQNELWIIDHGTSTEEAAGSVGGRRGQGGDLLYRWGNPSMHGARSGDQALFAQHDVHWIKQGLPGAGNLLVFNNGRGRPDGDYSSVDEIAVPAVEPGVYIRNAADGFAPATVVWSYVAPDKRSFYSPFVSGAQRLPNGNTVICSGSEGKLFEVTPRGEIVWEFRLPIKGAAPFSMGAGFLDGLFDMLDADKDDQLTLEEFRRMPAPRMPMMGMGGAFGPPPGFGVPGNAMGPPPGFGAPPAFASPGSPGPGFMPPPGAPLTDQHQGIPGQALGPGAPFGMPAFGPGAPGPFGMPPMGPLGAMNDPNALFRALEYPPDYAAFHGKTLTPGPTLEEALRGEHIPTPKTPPS
jgi:hypothetical protein